MCTCSSELDSSHCKADSRQQPFCRSFHAATTLTWRNKRYWINDSLDLRRAIRRMRQYIEQFVQKAIASAASTTLKQENKKYNLLSALAEQTQDHEELRNQLLAILVAGRGKHDPQQAIPPNETKQNNTHKRNTDTTAGLLGWSFARLAIHPDIFHKLRTRILSDFPPSSSSSTITFEKVKACRYLQHFLHEVLRLHPNVPFNNRQAAVDTTLPTGGGPDGTAPIVVAKGTTIAFSVYLMHRRPDLWGEDVLEFRPERWEEERRGSKWQFLPFSGGMYFFSSFPPKQKKVRIRVLSQTRPRHNLRYLFLFSDTFLLLLLSYLPTYLPTYYTLFSPFIRSPSLSRPAIRSRRSKLCNNTHPPNLRRHCTRRRDGNVSVA